MELEWLQWIGSFSLVCFFFSLAIFNFLFFPHSFVFALCLFFYFILLILCNIFCFSEFILSFGWSSDNFFHITWSCASSIERKILTFLFEQLVVANCLRFSFFLHSSFPHWALVYFIWYHFHFIFSFAYQFVGFVSGHSGTFSDFFLFFS